MDRCIIVTDLCGQVHVTYEGEEVVGSPVTFAVKRDVTKVKVLTSSGQCRVGKDFTIKVRLSFRSWSVFVSVLVHYKIVQARCKNRNIWRTFFLM